MEELELMVVTAGGYSTTQQDKERALVLWFEDVGMSDISLVGTPFPNELNTAITEAYSQLCQRYNIDFSYCDRSLDARREASPLEPYGGAGSHRFEGEEKEVCKKYSYDVDVAVRSSATAEDLPDASFAGQQETYLNVHDVQCVLEAGHKCFASLFTDRAISYSTLKGFDRVDLALSVGVQKMVRLENFKLRTPNSELY